MKARTHAERRERREEALRKAQEAVAAGESRKAQEFYQRACFVTSDMARNVIRECRKLNVEYVVAPYEADAQLAWMMRSGYIQSVITEDSDLLVYGASRIFYKMNKNGMGDMFESKNLSSLEAISMRNFTEDMFMYMCVCSGCDFFKGVQGLGIKKAHALIRRYKTLSRVLQAIRREPRYRVSRTFNADFVRACMVFRHQTVYDMNRKVHIHLRDVNAVITSKLPHGVLEELESGSFNLSFLGEHRGPDVARKIAEGFVHPRTLKEYDEPLDIVTRPILTKRRPRRFPSPPPKRTRLTPEPPKSIRGFQVQPASSRPPTPSSSARAQIDQSSTGSISFNPRRIGIAFRAQTRASHSTSGVWSTFRPSSRIEIKTTDSGRRKTEHGKTNGSDESEGDENGDSDAADFEKVNDDRNETRLSQSVTLSLDVDPQLEVAEPPDEVNENPCPERPRSSSHRVEAVHRALGKFARTKERDVRNKFKPHQSSSLPSRPSTPSRKSPSSSAPHLGSAPSPDANTFELFALVDGYFDPDRPRGDIASDSKGTDRNHRSPFKRRETSQKLSKSSLSASGKQLRLSRFFKPQVQSKEAKQSIMAAKSAKQNSKSSKSHSKKTVPHTMSIDMNAMDRLRRTTTRKTTGTGRS
ncbi:Exonuclease 1 [Gracilaria domingensis]|nr:Exonuclease 1 [Gracilaria domingensis]